MEPTFEDRIFIDAQYHLFVFNNGKWKDSGISRATPIDQDYYNGCLHDPEYVIHFGLRQDAIWCCVLVTTTKITHCEVIRS